MPHTLALAACGVKSSGVQTVLGLLEQGPYGSVGLPPPLNGDEGGGDSEAALGPVVDLSQQHLSLSKESAEPFVRGLELLIRRVQLARHRRYSSLQLGSQCAQLF